LVSNCLNAGARLQQFMLYNEESVESVAPVKGEAEPILEEDVSQEDCDVTR